MSLKTTYKDDVLDTAVNIKRKYTVTHNSDGTVTFTDVTEYAQEGDTYSATDINKQNTQINENTDDIKERVKTVNGKESDAEGNVELTLDDIGLEVAEADAEDLADIFGGDY